MRNQLPPHGSRSSYFGNYDSKVQYDSHVQRIKLILLSNCWGIKIYSCAGSGEAHLINITHSNWYYQQPWLILLLLVVVLTKLAY